MKLIKVLSETPVIGIEEALTLKDYIFVSDARFMLLLRSGVKMKIMKEFNENAVANLGSFDFNKTYIIKDGAVIKPSEFDLDFDRSEYKLNDYVLVYTDGPKFPGCPPRKRKPETGYQFTPEEQLEVDQEYEEALAEYQEKLDKYTEDVEKFIKEEASIEAYGYLIQILPNNKYKIICDVSYETTKDSVQFGVYGKLPKGIATKVTQAIGDFEADDTIKGLTIIDIFKKVLKLENEEDIVGLLLPEEDNP